MSAGDRRKLEEVLTKAVSELAKAAVDTSNQIPVETLEELRLIKKSVDILSSKTDALSTKAQETTATNTTQHAALLQQITTLTTAVIKSQKVPTLQWAISNANLGMFAFHADKDHRSNQFQRNSDAVVREILLFFMRGFGRFTEGFVFTQEQINGYRQVTAEEIATARTAFHTALITQIHSLTGTKPRIVPESSKFAIYYE